jgi:hypothetical protein
MNIDDKTVDVSVSEIVSAASYEEMEELIQECYDALPTNRFVSSVSMYIAKKDVWDLSESCGIKVVDEE